MVYGIGDTMDRLFIDFEFATVGEDERLMTQTHSQHGYSRIQFFDQVQTDSRVFGLARPRAPQPG